MIEIKAEQLVQKELETFLALRNDISARGRKDGENKIVRLFDESGKSMLREELACEGGRKESSTTERRRKEYGHANGEEEDTGDSIQEEVPPSLGKTLK